MPSYRLAEPSQESRGGGTLTPVTRDAPVSIRLLTHEDAQPDMLSAEERARLAAFTSPSRSLGFVLGRTAARTLLADATGCDPREAGLAVDASGAPVVEASPYFLSIAHTGGREAWGGAALARQPVGLDLERIAPRQPALWRRILSETEYPLLDPLGGPTDEAQTLLWSLKEAVLKARRTGLRAGMRSVSLAALDPLRQRAEATDRAGGAWHLGFERRGDLWVSWALARE